MLRLNRFETILFYALLIIYCLIILVPFGNMLMNSSKSLREIYMTPFGFPESFMTQNYVQAWQRGNIGTGYRNSALVAGVSVVSIVLLSSMFAFSISKLKFGMRRFFFMYSMLGLAFPARLAIIPIFLLMRSVGLTNSLIGLVIIYVAVNIPFSVFILKNFIDGVPNELAEAATIDGATPVQVYWNVVMPLVTPAVSIVAIVSFVNIWNDFFFPLVFINDRSKATITLAISTFFGEYGHQWHLLFAGLVLAIAPTIIMFVIFSRQFIAGMTQGAIK